MWLIRSLFAIEVFSSSKKERIMSNKQKRLIRHGLAAACLSLSAIAFAVCRPLRGENSKIQSKAASFASSIAEPSQGKSGQPQIVALPIVLKPAGFVPMDVTGSQGDYFFSVLNQSGAGEIVLRLDREHGNRLHEAHVKKERLRWRQTVHLTPGVYLLTEASHPRWVCRITIAPK